MHTMLLSSNVYAII